MLKRKIEAEIEAWAKGKDRKCLVIQGARQTGKTFSVERFAIGRYEELVEVNFKENPSAKEAFSGDLSVESMLMGLRFRFPDKRIAPGKTLLFFDEIQECPEAITSLKFWAIDNRFDVICSGSLLGIDCKRASSYPVGYVDYLRMTGLDFEEFLWAMGVGGEMISAVREHLGTGEPVPAAANSALMAYYRQYIAVGGMPEVVQKYADTRDFREVDRLQRALLQGYLYDIAHYASAEEKVKAERCYLSLSRQLLEKENHKFQYKEIEHGARAQKYYSSIDWLLRADLIFLSRLASDARFDLDDYARDDFFRAYPSDLSLLMAMKDFSLKQSIVEGTIEGSTKGGVYECAVADALSKRGYRLYFYKNEASKREVDLMIQRDGSVLPIEVKSGNGRAASLKSLMADHPEIPLAYKFIDGNVGMGEGGILSLPLYFAGLI